MVEKTINQKLETLTDYKIATIEAEKVSREIELHYLNKWGSAADAYIAAMENEIEKLSCPQKKLDSVTYDTYELLGRSVELFNGIEVIR